MKQFSAIVIAFLLGNFSLLAQVNTTSTLIDNDKDHYEENVFNKEFGEDNNSVNARKLYDKIPEKLPDWVFNPIVFGDSVKVVGYSDPNMEKEDAYKQAVLRAKAIYAIMKCSTVSNVTDDYTNLRESGKYSLYTTKFQDFTVSKAEMAYCNSGIVLVDTFYTKYNEGVVLIKFKPNIHSEENRDTLTVKGENLEVFIEKNFHKEKVEFFNWSIVDNLAKDTTDFATQYNYKMVNRGYDINSIYGDKIIEFEERTYNYRTNLDFEKDSSDLEINTFRLSRGLWNGYLTGILSNISALSKQLSGKVRDSNDFYTLKTEGLIRTVARNKVSFDFNDFKMYENQFYIGLNGRIIQ